MESDWPKAWPKVEESVDEVHIYDPKGDVLLQLITTTNEAPKLDEAIPLANDLLDFEASEESSIAPEEPLALEYTFNVYLRVSSKHLILSSDMFRKMLGSDTFRESGVLRSNGSFHLELSDDPEALIMLMYIVHGMTRKVPRDIPLDTLVEFAVLVNYYKVHESVELFSDIWISNLKTKSFPNSYNPEEVLSWLFISWVFEKADDFEKLTRILIYESDDKLPEHVKHVNIPIPESIVARIQERRHNAIENTIAVVHNQITRYFTSDILCSRDTSFECDAFILGSLLKSSMKINIWPRPEAPYHGTTVEELTSQILNMQVLDHYTRRGHSSSFNHDVKRSIETSISSLGEHVCGLPLDDFLLETSAKRGSKTEEWRNCPKNVKRLSRN